MHVPFLVGGINERRQLMLRPLGAWCEAEQMTRLLEEFWLEKWRPRHLSRLLGHRLPQSMDACAVLGEVGRGHLPMTGTKTGACHRPGWQLL